MLLVRLQEAPGTGVPSRRRPVPRVARAWTAAARPVRQRWSSARCRDELCPRPVPRGGASRRGADARVPALRVCGFVATGLRGRGLGVLGRGRRHSLTGPHGTPPARTCKLSPLLALADDDTPCRRSPRARSLRGDRAAHGRSASSPRSPAGACCGRMAAGRSGVPPDASSRSSVAGAAGTSLPATLSSRLARRGGQTWSCPPGVRRRGGSLCGKGAAGRRAQGNALRKYCGGAGGRRLSLCPRLGS